MFTGELNENLCVKTKLEHIPQILVINYTNYELREICSFVNNSESSVGHYKAYCKRAKNVWESYDNLNTTSDGVQSNVEVFCDLIYFIYSICDFIYSFKKNLSLHYFYQTL